MKLLYKIILIHLVLTVLFALLISLSESSLQDIFLFAVGIASLVFGLLDLVVSVLLLVLKKKEWGKGFLLTGGVLLLLSGAACSVYMTFQ